MSRHPPLEDMIFTLRHVAGMDGHIDPGDAAAVLEEAARLAREVWAPLRRAGDTHGARLENGAVTTAPGFRNAYDLFARGGWNGLAFPEAWGGQGLPASLGMAVDEIWHGANLALGLCPMLTRAAVEAILRHGSDAQKKEYLPALVSGEWTGTMQLTEPQAGTDLSAIRTVAKRNGDHYLLKGQKIFISWGDHDFTPNIIHLVLARVEGLPEGNAGLGLFIVPKILPGGARNDVRAVSLEHKLGLHGSPTCVMAFGEEAGAAAFLVGEEGAGLRNMFTMMNNARINVGVEGVAQAHAAYRHALAYARERVQGVPAGGQPGARAAIVRHPDVRRMLMTMQAQAEAARALAYCAGGLMDRGGEAAARRIDLLTPLIKAYGTDMAVDNASLCVQVHGGMGYVEETGAAQFYRDARVLPIYEGTNGIQSGDFLFRKVLRDGGAELRAFLAEIAEFTRDIDDAASAPVRAALEDALSVVGQTAAWMLETGARDAPLAAAGAQPFQRQCAWLAGGYLLARLARAAAREEGADPAFAARKAAVARFHAQALLPAVHGLARAAQGGAAALEPGAF